MKTFLVALLGFILFSCQDNHITGYCVGKLKTEGHMSDKSGREIKYATVIVPHPVIVHRSKPTWVKTTYNVAIANYDERRIIEVDSALFFKMKVGVKYNMK